MAERDRFHDIQQARFQWSVPEDGFAWDEFNLAAEWTKAFNFLEMLRAAREIEEHDWEKLRDRFPSPENAISKFIREASEGKGRYLTWRSANSRVSSYEPLEDKPGLFLEFAELEPTEEAFGSFANKYGSITGMWWWCFKAPRSVLSKKGTAAGIDYFTKVRKVHDSEDTNSKYYPIGGNPLSFWQDEHEKMSLLLKVWQGWKEQDVQALRGLISMYGPDSKSYRIFGVMGADVSIKDSMGLATTVIPASPSGPKDYKGDYLEAAADILTQGINHKLSVRLSLIRESEPRPVPYLVPTDLLSAMWFQFSQAITGESKFKRCPICGYWEDVTRKRSDWKRHDNCASSVRVARSNQRKKEAAAKAAKKAAGKKASRGGKK